MSAIVNTYSRTIQMADETVLSIMMLNKLWIPDVLIDIIKDYLYIDAFTVWRNFYKASINQSINSMSVTWSDLYDTFGRKRISHWSKGDPIDGPQLQCLTCVTCGESDSYHTNLDGCCELVWDYHQEGELILTEWKSDDDASYVGESVDDDEVSYQNHDEEYDW